MRRAVQKKPKRADRSSAQLGIFSVPDVNLDGSDEDDDDDDGALEAELLEILSSNSPARSKSPRPKAKPTLEHNLDKMVAESMKDIPSDASLSGDDDDPDLLAELNAVTCGEDHGVPEPKVTSEPLRPITNASIDTARIIWERIDMYKTAEANAKAVGDSSKARRLDRGLKTLQGLLKKAEMGATVDENEIPPPVSVAVKKAPSPPPQEDNPIPLFEPIDMDNSEVKETPPPPPPRPSITKSVSDMPPSPQENDSVIKLLTERRDEYKKAALMAKKSGDNETALSHVKIVKRFESVIAAASSGQSIDLATIPPPPSASSDSSTKSPPPTSSKPPTPPPRSSPVTPREPSRPDESFSQQPAIAPVPDEPKPPATVMEALEQRLAKFKEQEESAKRENNSSKVRRMGRIVKQYQDAIKLHKAGKPIPVDELPTPPGFAPIPVEGTPAPVTPGPAIAPKPSPTPSPTPPQRTYIPEDPSPSPSQPKRPAPPIPEGGPSSGGSIRHAGSKQGTRQEKQLAILEVKQKQFKIAALKAKQSGDLNLAKEYLRQAKCFDSLIEASINGFPVDLTSLPPPPGSAQAVEKEYEIVKSSDCLPDKPTSEIYTQLIFDLQHQLKMCMETRAHYKAMGDVAHANKFEQLAVATKKDLDTVKIACNKDAPIPKFHYERRTFEIVRCNTDLNDNDVELTIVQGINYNVPNPKEIDTYIRYEFPYPTDDPKKDRTPTIYNTNNPNYNAVFIIPIQRNNRSCQRIFKRHSIKLEVWSKGGFLRNDSLVASVNVKLLPLETKCTIHDSFDLMDGRKAIGGKLEVKVRVRHPIQTKQMEQMQEKWLVVD